jgi:hypothetical protein
MAETIAPKFSLCGGQATLWNIHFFGNAVSDLFTLHHSKQSRR